VLRIFIAIPKEMLAIKEAIWQEVQLRFLGYEVKEEV
jgi:hypothetical protein